MDGRWNYLCRNRHGFYVVFSLVLLVLASTSFFMNFQPRNGARARVSIRELLDWEVLSDCKFNPFRLSTPTGLESRLRRCFKGILHLIYFNLISSSPISGKETTGALLKGSQVRVALTSATFVCIAWTCPQEFNWPRLQLWYCPIFLFPFTLQKAREYHAFHAFSMFHFPIFFWTLSLLQCGG